MKKAYKDVTEDGTPTKWRDFLRTGGDSTPEERPNSYYPIFYNEQNNRQYYFKPLFFKYCSDYFIVLVFAALRIPENLIIT